MKTSVFVCVAIGLLQAAVAIAQDGKPAKVDAGDIQRLIDQLDNDEFTQRESATKQLTKLGRPAIEALTAAAAQQSSETRARSLSIIKTLFRSDDAATKTAAQEALVKLSKSDNVSVRRLAEKILAEPQYKLPLGIWRAEGTAQVFGGRRPIVLGGGGGVAITGAGIRIGAGGQLILARVSGGERRVDIIQGTGVGVLLLEGRRGIEIHVRRPQAKGDPKFSRYLAKDSKELSEKHPKIHKLYKKLDAYKANRTVIGGVKIDVSLLKD
jgi:ribosomal protein L17